MTEQISAYFNKLGISCEVFNTAGTVVKTIKGIFDNEFDATSTVGNFEIASSRPQVITKIADVTSSPAIIVGTKIRIAGALSSSALCHKVVEIQYNSLRTYATLILVEDTL